MTGPMRKHHEHERMLLGSTNSKWWGGQACLFYCLLFFAPLKNVAQNLVPNPSFELRDTCPYTFGFQEGDRPLFWYSWLNSPDYFNACASGSQSIDTLISVPQNGWTYQYAWEGESYVGFYAYESGPDEYREYVGTELLQPLEVGCAYLLRFRTNPAANGNYWLLDEGSACNNVGMLFTTRSNAWTAPFPSPPGPDFPYRNYAHLRTEVPVVDTALWTSVEGTFVADSAYTHLVLGNFFPNSLTTAFPIGNQDPWFGITYYLIDGVEVVPVDPDCNGLGLQESLATVEPNIVWTAEMIKVNWPGGSYNAELLDARGRLMRSASASSAVLELAQPNDAGVYILRLQSKESQKVVKFVVW